MPQLGLRIQMTTVNYFYKVRSKKEGQKLEDVRALMLEQIEKLKKGEFSDDLIPSVINNMKLRYYTSLQNNKGPCRQVC